MTDHVIELHIKDFIMTDTSTLLTTRAAYMNTNCVSIHQIVEYYMTHPFCPTLPKTLMKSWKLKHLPDKPKSSEPPIQFNISNDTFDGGDMGPLDDFGDSMANDYSIEIMRGPEKGDSSLAWRDSLTPLHLNINRPSLRRQSIPGSGTDGGSSDIDNPSDRLSFEPRQSGNSFNLNELLLDHDGRSGMMGNDGEEFDENRRRRSQSFVEHLNVLTARQQRVQFHHLLPEGDKTSRAEAAESFYNLLLLTQRNQLLVHQAQPYAPIDIQIVA